MATDQEIRDAGFKYIPQQKYLQNPYELPVADPVNDQGIVATNAFTGSGVGGFDPYNTNMNNIRQDYNAFPSRQAGEIYSKTFNPGPNPYATSMYGGSLPRAQSQYNLANQNISLTGRMTPERRAEIMRTTDDIIQNNRMKYATEGQYVDPYDPNYSSMTEAQKFMDNYPDYYGVPSGVPEPGIPGAIKRYMQNSLIGKGFGMAKDFLGRALPINERAIMENEARGAGIFTDDIGRIVTDDYNTAGGIMAGYNLNKIDADSFQKRRDTINKKMSDRINPETGKTFKQERLDLLDKSEEDILGARKKTKQIYKMRADKKAKDDTTGTDNGGNSTVYANENDPSDVSTSGLTYNQGGGQEGSYDFAEQNFSGPGNTTNAAGTEGEDQDRFMANGGRAGYFYGGRVNFKYGGLASIL